MRQPGLRSLRVQQMPVQWWLGQLAARRVPARLIWQLHAGVLLLRLQAQPAGHKPFALHSPRLDEVVLSLDPARFAFTSLQASHVLAPLADADALRANPGLAEAARGPDWVLLRVTGVQ